MWFEGRVIIRSCEEKQTPRTVNKGLLLLKDIFGKELQEESRGAFNDDDDDDD